MPPPHLESPNGRLRFELDTRAASFDAPGELSFQVLFDGNPVIDTSRLGLRLQDRFFARLAVEEVRGPLPVDDRYELLYGKRRELSGKGNELVVTCSSDGGHRLEIVVRAYDDGVAIRYRIPDQDPALHTFVEELTSFRFTSPGRAWIQPHDLPGWATPAYEAPYENGIPIGSPTELASWNMPALFETGPAWVLLAEAGLSPTYFGAHLGAVPDDRSYRIVPPHPEEGLGVGEVLPRSSLPWESPWRVIVIGDSLATIVETDLITHLSPPSRVTDISWIRPGRVSWSWWSDRASPQNLDLVQPFVDWAAEMGWEYTLIDAHWNVHSDDEVQEFVRGAAGQGVGVWLWYNSGGPHNEVWEQPRDRMHDGDVRRAELAKLASWGVAGIKVDFFHSDKQDGVKLYWDILADAADHNIMVNLHGCTVPRGWRRTWPHLLTMEAVRGAEQYGFDEHYPETAVWHNTILPFTRNVVGPMDYTPVTFGDFFFPHRTTNGHELALAVVFESGLLHYADSVTAYRATPEYVQELLRDIPAAWEETRFIDGYPGEYAVLARRTGSTWYLAGINGTWEEKHIDVPLKFLTAPASGLTVTDAPDGTWHSAIRTYRPSDRFEIDLHPAGGFLARLEPEARNLKPGT